MMVRFLSFVLFAWLGTHALAGENGSMASEREVAVKENPSNLIEILFDGEPGTRFQATLRVQNNGTTENHELEGAVPSEHRYHGEALEANVRQTSPEGGLTVEVRKGGNISRSRSHGEHSQLSLKVR
ncbi:hypothetical protein ACOJCM_04975 [Billgrantia sp. LNSP4103-1]|uniref:hypothetical protein n=1 Tax=Billgrantia sp. LNSP4103-1 TaxID=3410266 RepID=UPI00403F5137